MEQILTKEDWLKVGREYGVTKGAKELSQDLGVSRQRIHQLVAELRRRGVPIPDIRRRGVIGEVVEILVRENKKVK